MINVIETLIDYIKNSSTDDPPSRPHIGETMGCWLYFTALAEEIPALETCLNTTTNTELLKLVQDSKNLAESQIDTLKKLMIKEGIPLPEIPATKPKSDPNSIPLGAKATDSEIANLISVKIASNIVMCSTNMGQSIRTDIGLMWLKFHTEKIILGSKVKILMQQKGWLKIPPYYYPPGAPHNSN